MAKKTIHTLEEIYPESAVAAQRERYEKSAEEFRSIFGDSDQLRYFSAPGRTEVGGNHTDHNSPKIRLTYLTFQFTRMKKIHLPLL